MPYSLESFIADYSKKGLLPIFSYYTKLKEIEKQEFLQSIYNYQSSRSKEEITKLRSSKLKEDIEIVALNDFYLGLKNILHSLVRVGGNEIDLKGTEQKEFYFPKKLLNLVENEEKQLLDYEGNKFRIKKINNKYQVYFGGEYINCQINENNDFKEQGFECLYFQTQYNYEKEFLNEVTQKFYEYKAATNRLGLEELISYGMIKEAAKFFKNHYSPTLNEHERYNVNLTEVAIREIRKFAYCIGSCATVFEKIRSEKKSSIHHLIINDLPQEYICEFFDSIPVQIRKEYLKLTDENNQTVLDIAEREDVKAVIRRYMVDVAELDENIENFNQNIHLPPVNNSSSESIIRITAKALKKIGIRNFQTDQKGRSIKLDHHQLEEFTNNKINDLKNEFLRIRKLSDEELFNSNILPTLAFYEQQPGYLESPQFKEQKAKLIAFTKFKLEKSDALLNDLIINKNIGQKYMSNVDTINTNGLSIREIVALVYDASMDEDSLILPSGVDRESQKIAAKMKFIDSLYSMRRGYNIDFKEDNLDSLKFSPDKPDYNVCASGAINRLGEALNTIHQDVEIRASDERVVLRAIQRELVPIINDYINSKLNSHNNEEIEKLAVELDIWKNSKLMPNTLSNSLAQLVAELLTENHPLVQEYEIDYQITDLKGTMARQAIEKYTYPGSEIKEIPLSQKQTEDFIQSKIEYYTKKPFQTDQSGGYALGIDLEIQRDHSFIKTLMDCGHNLNGLYVKRDNFMTPIIFDYLRYYNDCPLSIVNFCINNNNDYIFSNNIMLLTRVLAAQDEIKTYDQAKATIDSVFKAFIRKRDSTDNEFDKIKTGQAICIIIEYFPSSKINLIFESSKAAVPKLLFSRNHKSAFDLILKKFSKHNAHDLIINSVKDFVEQTPEKFNIDYQRIRLKDIIVAFKKDNSEIFCYIIEKAIGNIQQKYINEFAAFACKSLIESDELDYIIHPASVNHDIDPSKLTIQFTLRKLINNANGIFYDDPKRWQAVEHIVKAIPSSKRAEIITYALIIHELDTDLNIDYPARQKRLLSFLSKAEQKQVKKNLPHLELLDSFRYNLDIARSGESAHSKQNKPRYF